MASPRLPLHVIVDGLVNLSGESTQEAAIRAGISPGTVAAHRSNEPTQVVTWCRMASALGCTLAIESQGRSWTVDLPRPAPALMEREWRAWRHRRMISAQHSVADLQKKLKRAERDARVERYVTNEEERLQARLITVQSEVRSLTGQHRVAGFRQAVRLLAEKLAITAEELSLLAGVHLAAAQNALGEDNDGRLITLHRLASAMNARIRLDLGGKGSIDISPCPPGPWKLGDRDEDAAAKPAVKGETGRIGNRSQLVAEQILALYDAEMSIGEIARKAGISRQRVHKIAMDHGRSPRRALAKERRIATGRDQLSTVRS